MRIVQELCAMEFSEMVMKWYELEEEIEYRTGRLIWAGGSERKAWMSKLAGG